MPYAGKLPPMDQMRLFNKAGSQCQWLGDYETAVAYHQRALTLARQTGDQTFLAHTLHFLGNAAGRQGDYETARTTLEESLVYHRTLPDIAPAQLMTLLNNLGIVYRRLGNYERATELLQETLIMREATGDDIGKASVLSNLGNLAILQGDLVRARVLFGQSLRLRQEVHDRLGLATVLSHMADLALQEKQWLRSVRLYAASQRQFAQLQVPMTADALADYERNREQLRAALDEFAFAQAEAAGAAMSLDEAVAYTLTDSP